MEKLEGSWPSPAERAALFDLLEQDFNNLYAFFVKKGNATQRDNVRRMACRLMTLRTACCGRAA